MSLVEAAVWRAHPGALPGATLDLAAAARKHWREGAWRLCSALFRGRDSSLSRWTSSRRRQFQGVRRVFCVQRAASETRRKPGPT